MVNCYRQMLQGLFTHRIAPDLVNDTLRQHCLFAGGLRNCLILHTFNEVPRTADKSTLLKSALPTRNRFMHYALPAPIETVYKPQVTRVLRSEVGYRSPGESRTYQKGQVKPIPAEASMLTGDENIVNVQFSVQYRIADPVAYLFDIYEPDALVRSAAEAAMREVIGNSLIDAALTDGKLQIQADATRLLQNILDRYHAGLQVIAVQLQDVHPPDEVRNAFKDVASAREDKIRIINEAEAYRNELLPRARGEAAAIRNKAEAYRATRVQNAEGEAARFAALSAEHERSPRVMEHRLYYETLEELLKNAREKVLLDGKSPERILPYLPLSGLTAAPAAGTTEKR